jgi:hypothetical protein
VSDPSALPRLVFVSQWYQADTEHRRRELAACVAANLENEAFDELAWFVPERDLPSATWILMRNHRVKLLPIERGGGDGRLTYGEAFAQMDRTDTVYVLANADIAVPCAAAEAMRRRIHAAKDHRLSICLARWDAELGCDGKIDAKTARPRNNAHYSQDMWALRGGEDVANRLAERTTEIPLDTIGADNRIAWELKQMGAVTNPIKSVVTLHVHRGCYAEDNRRKPRIGPPHQHILPCS